MSHTMVTYAVKPGCEHENRPPGCDPAALRAGSALKGSCLQHVCEAATVLRFARMRVDYLRSSSIQALLTISA
jgi:hypothetical protein